MAASRVPDAIRNMAAAMVEAVETCQNPYSAGWYKKWHDFCVTVIVIRKELDRLRHDSVDVPEGLTEAVKLLEQQRSSSSPWKPGDGWAVESKRALALLADFRPQQAGPSWSKTRSRKDWHTKLGISTNTFDRRRKDETYRTRKQGKLIQVLVDDLPAGVEP